MTSHCAVMIVRHRLTQGRLVDVHVCLTCQWEGNLKEGFDVLIPGLHHYSHTQIYCESTPVPIYIGLLCREPCFIHYAFLMFHFFKFRFRSTLSIVLD